MSEAPERIWLIETDKYNPYRVSCSTAPHSPDESTEYVRADRIEALERENAALRDDDAKMQLLHRQEDQLIAAEAREARLSEAFKVISTAADALIEDSLNRTKAGMSWGIHGHPTISPKSMHDLKVALFSARAALAGSSSGWRECATEGCAHAATVRCARDGVESEYCHACYMRIWELPAAPQQGGE